jgi:hypothetical protein
MLSHIASKMRGSVGGITYLSNQYHQIVARVRTTPTNPMTSHQTTARSAFAGAATAWKMATQIVRDGWEVYAQSLHYPGPLGPYTVPGRQVFTSLYQLIGYIVARGLATIAPVWVDTAPVIGGFLNISDIVEVAPTGPGTGIAVSITNLDSTTRLTYKGPWLTNTPMTVAKLCAAITSTKIEFMTLVAGKIYFLRIRMISNVAPFKLGPEYILRCTAVTVP